LTDVDAHHNVVLESLTSGTYATSEYYMNTVAKPNLSSAAQFDATHCERNKQAFDKIEIVNNCSEKGGPHANLNPLTFSYKL
jgi:hypothetical protein